MTNPPRPEQVFIEEAQANWPEPKSSLQRRVEELEQELSDARSSIASERQEYRGTVEHWKEFHNSLCITLGLRFRLTGGTLEAAKNLTTDNARLRELLRDVVSSVASDSYGTINSQLLEQIREALK